jgi:hypothetical protein
MNKNKKRTECQQLATDTPNLNTGARETVLTQCSTALGECPSHSTKKRKEIRQTSSCSHNWSRVTGEETGAEANLK